MKNCDLPVFINCKDRLSCLQEILHRLRCDGFEKVTIIDTGSTWPPLLEFYTEEKLNVKHCTTEHAPKNALWDCGLLDIPENSFYVYTDCDTVPDYCCPSDWPARMLGLMEKYPRCPKAGLGLRIDNLPNHYAWKARVIKWESKFWKKVVEPEVFEAEIDTTMAVYRYKTSRLTNAIRTGYPYLARHLPWYEVSKYPTPEHQHYLKNLHPKAGHWSKLEKNEIAENPSGATVST